MLDIDELKDRAWSLRERHEYSKAIEILNLIIKESPYEWEAYNSLIDIYTNNLEKEGRDRIAELMLLKLDEAIQKDPDKETIYTCKINLLLKLMENEKACETYDDILKIFPEKNYFLLEKADFLKRTGKFKKAAPKS